MNAKTFATLAAVCAWPLLTAGSCATTREPEVRYVNVPVPTPVPCVDDRVKPAPTYPASIDDLLKMTPGERYAKSFEGMALREQRLMEIEPVLAGCRIVPKS